MYLLWFLLFACLNQILGLNISQEAIENLIKNAKPGHLELDKKYQHLFQNDCARESNASRIAGGGWESEPYSRPYQVGIYTPTPSGSSFCGGSLITDQVVLTAAHCVMSAISTIVLYLGAHNMPPLYTENAVTSLSIERFVHPEWDAAAVQNDIALLYLWEPVVLNERIQTIPLPTDASDNYLGQPTLVSGWGLAGDGEQGSSPVLREVKSRVISNVACRLAYMSTVQRDHICTSGEEKKSTCRGDSGGPLVIDGVQVGVVSFGVNTGCEVGWPPAHSRITSYLSWINANLIPPSIRQK